MNRTNRRIPSIIPLSRVYRTLTTTRHSQDVCRSGNAPHVALLLSSKMAPFKVPKPISTLLSTAPEGFNKEGELLCRMFYFQFQPTEGIRTTNKSWERDRHDLSLEPGHHNGEDD
ncbi:hypothetical protein D6D01_00888 [Aureobasidium pullulans]|uniref:Uncharacterized protein n=1 Tax=Aureobasidium pullulans TaxID=5580 RepID=A0A4S9M0W0_AURPU|nr:hypothetical protein D6D01_00888 [Aureobasidium pullulans]